MARACVREVGIRVTQAKNVWLAYHRFWVQTVDLSFKCLVCRALFVSILLSGLDPLVLTKQAIDKFEGCA
eukprot:9689300-Lingulodinium_polyedra.AAC.1